MKSLILSIFLCFVGIIASAQNYDVKGTVVDSNGIPLPGVSIVVKNTTKGTTTDFDGKFLISVQKGTSILLSYIGYESKEIAINNGNPLRVALLESLQSLNEVVVVGYGTQKRSDVTGAVSKVEMDNAIAIPTTNISEMIRGQAAGVQVSLGSARPGGTSDILIRGRNSIRGGNEPLVVLDGFPIENINDVNPDDITSIEVLKDASAQAIYGARASNGVILITTKKGKDGKVRVSINSYTTIQKLTKNFDLYSADEFVKLRREAVRSTNPVVNGVQEYSDDSVNFNSATESTAFLAGNFVNWEDEVLQTGVINSHTFSISGGNENTKVFSSANYFEQTGLIPTSGYKRGAFRLNLNQKINDKASIEANLNVSTANQQKETTSLDFVTISPLTGPYDVDGNLVKDLAGANASSSSVNPLWNIKESDNDIKTDLYNLNLVANYKLSTNFSYKLNTLLSRRFIDQGEYITKLHSQGVTPNGSATVSNTLREEYLIENIFNYTPQINENNKLDITFVQSVNQRNSSKTTTDATGFGNDVLGYDGISGALNYKATRDEEQYRLSSFLGRIRYTLMDTYLLTLTGRKDGASVFAKNNKWGFFPAASFAWQLHKESFLTDIETINELKLRISYGSVGNQSLDPYTTLGVVDNYPYIFGGAIVGGNLPGTVLPNPNLTWETSTTTNIGLDYGLFSNRLKGTLEYYNTKTTDLLTDISLGGNSGFSSMITNGGETKNSGIELLLTGDIIRNNNLKWSVTGVFTKNKNEITKTGIVDVDGIPKDDLGRNRYVGEPINVYRAYVFDGIFQTDEAALASAQAETLGGTITPFQKLNTLFAGAIKLQDTDGNGVINDDDKIVIARDPDWYSSISSTIQYKGFELLADVYIVEGAKRYNPFLADFNEGGTITSVRNGMVRDYWTPENPSNTAPRPNYANAPANISVLGITDASYVRLRTLSLSYNLPQSVLGKLKINAAKLYITGSNLITITDYKSYSPENNAGDFPDTKSFTVGVNITL
ncbi:MAG: TonB-dependent receptor [Lutibacter sp.]|nr:TonB-dependent receptor [Lutibacter sp.]MBP9601270.1 TonB-dependent receptor [Lutibacter sp.]